MELDPSVLPAADCYKLLIGTIVPRPIALVSTISAGGLVNLAPFSFFTGVGSNPMLVLFCPANNPDGSEKDTLRNAAPPENNNGGGTGEFVVSSAVETYASKMAACAEPLAYGQSEFALAGLTPAPSRVVRPPRVLESPVALECRTVQVIRTNPGAPSGGNIVIGRVVHVFIADGLINDRLHVSPDALKAVGRMGGLSYVRTSDPSQRFEMPMGRKALEA